MHKAKEKALPRRKQILALRLEGYTYAEIARQVGCSRQRIQQMVSPPTAIRQIVQDRAQAKCESCGIFLGTSGHVHHKGTSNLTPDTYNDLPNLQYLCKSCHRGSHHGLLRPRLPKCKQCQRQTYQLKFVKSVGMLCLDCIPPGAKIMACGSCGKSICICGRC